eukprot:TRINITY_DN8734_c0_g2_i5.p2 TRINITY_DN8734_c0_g2~~TRINITY_DN8734_c0_g2_i5.p2  ORF type:complete len:109 (-),score=22.30 TRINITY_DN8734_c0_g2_i5:363-665(-)
MIRRPPRSTRKESSAASDVYKRQTLLRLSVTHKLTTSFSISFGSLSAALLLEPIYAFRVQSYRHVYAPVKICEDSLGLLGHLSYNCDGMYRCELNELYDV